MKAKAARYTRRPDLDGKALRRGKISIAWKCNLTGRLIYTASDSDPEGRTVIKEGKQ